MTKKIWQRIFSALLLMGMLINLAAPAHSYAAITTTSKQQDSRTTQVEPTLAKQIEADGSVGYLIYFRDHPNLSAAQKMNWSERGWFVMQTLQDSAKRSQAQVRSYLDAQGAKYQAFWIDNVIVVEKSSSVTFNGLMNFSEIESLRARREPVLFTPEKQDSSPTAVTGIEPNLTHVGADQAWNLGYNGSGLVVASIDTGVRYTHQALVNQYRGNLGGGSYSHDYNWYDPYDLSTAPNDSDAHGSHTMGTMVGDDGSTNQIGIAPGATWMACQGFNPSATDAGLLACGQFMAAPTKVDGTSPNPDYRPNVVNNSWGDCGTAYDSWYQGVIDSWHAAGVYPVFSNGNASNCGYPAPPGLNTVGNPARYGNLTGVGSSGQSNGQYATHSNWGPTDNPDTVNPRGYPNLKPQVLAPGVNIRSSVSSSDTAYEGGWDGTSMSAPHVTGLVALMWQAAPCMVGDYAATETMIEQTATPINYNSGGTPPPGPGNVPNYATGWGEINALDAVKAAANYCGDSQLTGQVTDDDTGDPVTGAQVAASTITDTRQTLSNAQGYYTMTLWANTYDVSVATYGYEPWSQADVVVSGTTTLDIALTPADTYVVSGTIRDADTNWPLYARITVGGYPGAPVWSDPETGFYSIELAEAITYTFKIEAFYPGYTPGNVSVGPLSSDATEEFALQADAATCNAPGYELDISDLLSNGFENATFPPTGWAAYNVDGGGSQWARSTARFHSGTASAAHVYSAAGTQDGWLVMPQTTLGDAPRLGFWESVNFSSYYIKHSLWVCTSGCTTPPTNFTEVAEYDSPLEDTWQQRTTLLSAYANQTVTLAFRYEGYDADDWYIDDVIVQNAACMPPTGGLVIGNVYDDQTLLPLNDALVEHDGGLSMITIPTPFDTHVDDGFYYLYSDAITTTSVFTASYPKYTPVTANVLATAGNVEVQDFSLPAGQLSVHPKALADNLVLGDSVTLPITITNSGKSVATYAIIEKAGAAGLKVIGHPSVAAPTTPRRVELTLSNAGPSRNNPTSAWINAGDVTLAVDDGSLEDSVGVNSGTAASQFIWLNRFTPAAGDFPFQLDEISVIWPTGQATAGDSVELVVYEDPDGDGDPSNATYLGSFNVTVQTADSATWNIYTLTSPLLLQGPGDVLIGAIDRFVVTGVTPVSYPAAIDTTLSQGRSWVGWWTTDPPTPPVLPPDTTFDTLDNLGLPGNLMIRGSGTLGSPNIPWVSESPITGTLAAGDSQVILVTLDASVVTQPGDYLADLIFKNDTPYGNLAVPVTMTVTAPPTYGELTGTVTGLGYCDSNPEPLAGLDVVIEGITNTYTATTNAQGVYVYYIDAAESPLTVSVDGLSQDYGAATASGVAVRASDTTTLNFNLRLFESCIDVAPKSLEVTLLQGTDETLPITITNSGAGGGSFEMSERPGTPLARTITRPAGASRLDARSAPAQVGTSAPVHVSRPDAILISEGFEGNVIPPTDWTQVINDPSFTWKISTTATPHGGTYAADVEYDDALNPQNEWLLSPELALTEGTLSFWSQGSLYWCRDTNDNCDLNVWIVVGAVGGGDDVFVGKGDDAWPDNWTWAQSTFDLTSLLPGGPVRIGFQYEGTDGAQIALDDIALDGATGKLDVPWLSESPITGTLGADSYTSVDVTFTASPTMTVGTYTATLQVKTNDPMTSTIAVPVTMHVISTPTYGVKISPNQSLSGSRGETITYTVQITNTSNGPTDNFTVTLGTHAWVTTLDLSQVGPLDAGESTTVHVVVHIPAGAANGASDAVLVTVRSHADPTKTASTTLTSHAVVTIRKLYLPLIFK